MEGHQQKIERIYEEIRQSKGSAYKITPKIIRSQLLETFDIDIYAKCTDNDHRRFLKKKLDNLMKAIRQKERVSEKKDKVTETSSTTTTATKKKPTAARTAKKPQSIVIQEQQKQQVAVRIASEEEEENDVKKTNVFDIEIEKPFIIEVEETEDSMNVESSTEPLVQIHRESSCS